MILQKNNPASKKEQLILINSIEELVKAQVKETIKELGTCDCEACYLKSCALALNSLEPKYVTTTKGSLISEITTMLPGNRVNIIVAVTKAVKDVAECAHH